MIADPEGGDVEEKRFEEHVISPPLGPRWSSREEDVDAIYASLLL